MRKILTGALAALAMTACTDSDSFKVDGTIEGADDAMVVVERADYGGYWQPIDSTRTAADGNFKIDVKAAGAPEIYRLRLGESYIYFPVDSTENVSIRTSKAGFGRDYTIEGSEQAMNFAEFDKEVVRLPISNADSVAGFKRKVFNKYIKDSRGSLMSYYVLTKAIGNKLLFDPQDKEDVKYYSAVATAFKEFNGDDPRTAVLERMALQGMKMRNKELGKKVVISAEELKVIDIDLPGIDGKSVKLSKTMQPGKGCVVAFTSIQDANTPAIIIRLREIAERTGCTLYHVNVGGDRFRWKNSVENLPWISVYADPGTDADVLKSYNVSAVPTFFIYNSAGELTDRAETVEQLGKKI